MDILSQKNILITGGTGSFGKAFLYRCLRSNVSNVTILSRDEKKQDDLRRVVNDSRVRFVLGDVRDKESLYDAFGNVDYIFHAAALKQVPSCEFYPMEALRTNVLGTENVISVASSCDVKKVVVLSTDKAVYPINVMGISKALAEKVAISRSLNGGGSKTVVCATRYGNVMASRGSVIPLFVSQIKAKQPLTITDPSMTRFLMSLEESVDLVLQALSVGEMGDIYVQKSPSATIQDLAMAVCEVFNYSPKFKIIGTRHGEKLFETLVSREEMIRAESSGKFFRILSDTRSLNYEKFFDDGETLLTETDDYTSHNTQRLSHNEIVKMLRNLSFIKESLND